MGSGSNLPSNSKKSFNYLSYYDRFAYSSFFLKKKYFIIIISLSFYYYWV